MEATGKLNGVTKDWQSGKYLITFAVESLPADLSEIQGCDTLDITARKHRNKRSLNANALLWVCLGKIAAVLNTDKWSVYLEMLKRYGTFTVLMVWDEAVEAVKRQWRESEVIGRVQVNGEWATQMLCYYGSSTYNTKEFSVLLDGVASEMEEMGLESPSQEELRRSIEAWEKLHDSAEID